MKNIIPMSLEEYEKSVEKNCNTELCYELTTDDDQTSRCLSPFSSSNENSISECARKKILDYSHPIDGKFVGALDNPTINAVLSKFVQTGIDASYGVALSTGIHITNKTNPELYSIIEECSRTLGIAIPYVVISDSLHGLNACTCGTNQFSYIMISSLLPMVMSREELCFVIGHEFGHLAMGHALYHTAGQLLGTAGTFLPVVGNLVANAISISLNAWSRRSEITADRAGLICCKDLSVAKQALFRLEAGLYSANGVDIDEYVKESQEMLSHSHLGKLSEYTYSHPIIPKRIKALEMFEKSEVYANAMGYKVTDGMMSKSDLDRNVEHIIEVLDNPLTQ